MESIHWQKVPKQYFLGDPARPCYVEKNPKISGTPLWPKDIAFHCKKIENNLKATRLLLERAGGVFISGHIPLSEERKIDPSTLTLESKPKRLRSSFVSAFLLPRHAIQTSQIGFYPHQGEIPPLGKTVKNLKGTWLLTNLGFFLTQKLIDAHNKRHPKGEQLSQTAKGYLGGFFVRQEEMFIGYPPHFGTSGVGITKEGKPVLVNAVELKGGTVYFDEAKLDWKKEELGSWIFTPSHTPAQQTIGHNRVNIVIFNEGTGTSPTPKIVYIKEGAILQPAAGVVFSIEKSLFKKLRVTEKSKVRFEFEPWFEKNLWNQLSCFYEGLLKLTPKGEPDFAPWLHPHACLTQETFIPNERRREPRAVLIETKNYFGAIAFSGRYEYSIGISFVEMPQLLPEIVRRMGVKEEIQTITGLDGGSGVKLCLVENGTIKPLNWIAPGTRNRMGDPNGNTYSALLLKLAN